MDRPRNISVVVIARNEEKCILKCLESLAAQDYPREFFEVVLVDNASTDSTSTIAHEFIRTFPNLRVVENPIRGVAATRNAGIRAAKHDIVAFIDADCEATVSWLSTLERVFREETANDSKVAAIGGPNVMPDDTTHFRRVVAVAVTNYYGNHGSVQAKVPGQRIEVDHLPTLNVMYDKNKVLEVGLFDEKQGNISEDVDMSHRLRSKGYRLLCEPSAVISHRWREDIWSWMRNIEVYGKGRTWLMKKDRTHIKPQFAAPLLLLLACLMALVVPMLCVLELPEWFCVLLLAPLSTYVVLTLLMSIYACVSNGKPQYIPEVFIVYTVTHLSYGVGQIHGFLAKRGSDTSHR
ncbi:MAG: glycosyltransferase [Candidatus Melainabacteria bacterium]|nr:glycosyltransferase [Candidatus Melainabacteria bacterium]